jgi:SUN domain-containing protein 1/2
MEPNRAQSKAYNLIRTADRRRKFSELSSSPNDQDHETKESELSNQEKIVQNAKRLKTSSTAPTEVSMEDKNQEENDEEMILEKSSNEVEQTNSFDYTNFADQNPEKTVEPHPSKINFNNVPQQTTIPTQYKKSNNTLEISRRYSDFPVAKTSKHKPSLLSHRPSERVTKLVPRVDVAQAVEPVQTPTPPKRTRTLHTVLLLIALIALFFGTIYSMLNQWKLDSSIKQVEVLTQDFEDKLKHLAVKLYNNKPLNAITTKNFEEEIARIQASIIQLRESQRSYDINRLTEGKVKQLINDYIETRMPRSSQPTILETRLVEFKNDLESDLKKYFQDYIKKSIDLVRFGDDTNMTDFALKSTGVQVLDSSPNYNAVHWSSWLKIDTVHNYLFKGGYALPPETIFTPDNSLGNCWAFPGSRGYISFLITYPIIPSSFTLEHVSRALMIDQSSAPRTFTVFGFSDPDDHNGDWLGDFEYKIDGNVIQNFIVEKFAPGKDADNEKRVTIIDKRRANGYRVFNVRFTNNYGNEQYTCVYRLRVHGQIVKERIAHT